MIKKIKEFINNIKNKISPKYNKFSSWFHDFFDKNLWIILMVIVTILSLIIRYIVVLSPTNDSAGIVLGWMDEIDRVGANNFHAIEADYSLLYLAIIALFSLLPKGELITRGYFTFYANRLIYVKSLMFLTDIGIAIGIFLLIKHLSKSKIKSSLGYSLFLILPVQYFNSAIWGNCDCMYMIFFVFIFYCLFKHMDRTVWLLMGFVIGVKLQAVFILPFLIYLCLSKKLTFYKIIYIIPGYFITVLPAIICGCDFIKAITFIGIQLGRWNDLTYGCANFWHLVYGIVGGDDLLGNASTLIGLLFIGALMVVIYMLKIDLSDENMIVVGTFLIAIVPFFLPHMHERYFYPLDVMVLVYALIKGRRYWYIPLMQISSGIAITHYLSGRYFIEILGEDSVNIATFINIAVLLFIFYDILKLNKNSTQQIAK